MSAFEHDDDQEDLPTFEDLKKMSKAEIQALVASSRAALESVVSMPDAVRSEKYNAIVSEKLEAAEDASRGTERLLAETPLPPEPDGRRLSEAATEASRLLEGDLLAQNDETWRETLVRLRQIGKETTAAEKTIASNRAGTVKLHGELRQATGIDDDIRSQAQGAISSMLRDAGVDWRLMVKQRSKPAVDPDFYHAYYLAQKDFSEKTPMSAENAERLAALKEKVVALESRIGDMRRQGEPGAAHEALRQLNVLKSGLSDVLMVNRRITDPYEHTVELKGEERVAQEMEELDKERQALTSRRAALAGAFLGKLRHGSEIDSLERQIGPLNEKISNYTRALETFGREKKRKERASEAMAALRGVELG